MQMFFIQQNKRLKYKGRIPVATVVVSFPVWRKPLPHHTLYTFFSVNHPISNIYQCKLGKQSYENVSFICMALSNDSLQKCVQLHI